MIYIYARHIRDDEWKLVTSGVEARSLCAVLALELYDDEGMDYEFMITRNELT